MEDNKMEGKTNLLSSRGKRLINVRGESNKPFFDTNNETRKSRYEKKEKKKYLSRSKSLFGYKTDLIKNKILDAKESFTIDPITLTNYPKTPSGLESLKETASQFISRNLSTNVLPGNIIISPGILSSLDMLAFILYDPGDCILVPTPYYKKYNDIFNVKNQIKIIPIPFDNLSIPKLSRTTFEKVFYKNSNVKGILLTNPHNPTGAIFELNEIEDIVDFASKHSLSIIMDEANAFSVYDQGSKHKFESILKSFERFNKYKNIFWTWSFSKDMLLPGLRFSLMYIEDEESYKCLDQLTNYNNVNSLTQKFAEEFLNDKEWFEELTKTKNEELSGNREMVMTKLRSLQIPFVKPFGGFLLYFNLKNVDSSILIKFLENNIYFEYISSENNDNNEGEWFAINLSQKREYLYDLLEKMGNIIIEYREKKYLQRERCISNNVADGVMKNVLNFLENPKEEDKEFVKKISQNNFDNCNINEDVEKNYDKDYLPHIVNECNLTKRSSENNNDNDIEEINESNNIISDNSKSQQKDKILLSDGYCKGEEILSSSNHSSISEEHLYLKNNKNTKCNKKNCPICDIEKRKENVNDKKIGAIKPIDLEEVFQIKLMKDIDNVKNDWITEMINKKDFKKRSKSYDVQRFPLIEEEQSNDSNTVSENDRQKLNSDVTDEKRLDEKAVLNLIDDKFLNDKTRILNNYKVIHEHNYQDDGKNNNALGKQVFGKDTINNDIIHKKESICEIPLELIFNPPNSSNETINDIFPNQNTIMKKEDNIFKLDTNNLKIDSINDIVIEDGDIIIVEERQTIIEGDKEIPLDIIFDKILSNGDQTTIDKNQESNYRKIKESGKINSYTVRSINNKNETEMSKNMIDLDQIFLNDGDQKEFKEMVLDNDIYLTKNEDSINKNDNNTTTITFCKTQTNIESSSLVDHHDNTQQHTQLIEPSKINFLSTEELNINEDGTKIYTESCYDTEMNLKKDEDIDKISIHFKDNISEHIHINVEDNSNTNDDELFMKILDKKSDTLSVNPNKTKQISPITNTDGESNTSFSYFKVNDKNNLMEILKIDDKVITPKESFGDNKDVKSYNPIDLDLIFSHKNDGDLDTLFETSNSSTIDGRRYTTHESKKLSASKTTTSGVEKRIQKKSGLDFGIDDSKSCDSGFTGDKLDNEILIKNDNYDYRYIEWNGSDNDRDEVKKPYLMSKEHRSHSTEDEDDKDHKEKNKEWIQDWERTNSFKDVNKKTSRERGTSFTEMTVDLSDIIGISIKENSDLTDSSNLSPEMRVKSINRDSGYCRDSLISACTGKSHTPRRLSYSYDITTETLSPTNEASAFLRECKKESKYDGYIPRQWNLTNDIITNRGYGNNVNEFIEYSVTKNEYKSIPNDEIPKDVNDIFLDVKLIQKQKGSAVGYYFPSEMNKNSYITELHLLPKHKNQIYSTELHIPAEDIYTSSKESKNIKEVDYIHPETNAKHFIIKSFVPSPIRSRKIIAKPLKFESNYEDGKDGVKITYEIFKKTPSNLGNEISISLDDKNYQNISSSPSTPSLASSYDGSKRIKKNWYVTSIKKTPRPAFKAAGSLTIDIKLNEKDMK
uniref:Aminotran_1_2 domain-containing protein n=1 Tax=Parastrongyloides trichosuri TaxID=131310 RepID=A0A0N4ZA62_PARTI